MHSRVLLQDLEIAKKPRSQEKLNAASIYAP